MNLEDLKKNPELQEKLKSATNPEELFAIAKEMGYELSDEELESINGGKDWWRCENYHATSGPY